MPEECSRAPSNSPLMQRPGEEELPDRTCIPPRFRPETGPSRPVLSSFTTLNCGKAFCWRSASAQTSPAHTGGAPRLWPVQAAQQLPRQAHDEVHPPGAPACSVAASHRRRRRRRRRSRYVCCLCPDSSLTPSHAPALLALCRLGRSSGVHLCPLGCTLGAARPQQRQATARQPPLPRLQQARL